jgi:hypothetical protein
MTPCHPRHLVRADGPRDVHGVPVARIGIAEHRHVHGAGNVAGVVDHLGLRHQTDVRVAALGRGAEARHVDSLKSYPLGNLGMERIQHKRRRDHRAAAEHLPQPRRGT